MNDGVLIKKITDGQSDQNLEIHVNQTFERILDKSLQTCTQNSENYDLSIEMMSIEEKLRKV